MKTIDSDVNGSAVRSLTEGQRRAQRTLVAAQKLMQPIGAPEMSAIEMELAQYVKHAYGLEAIANTRVPALRVIYTTL